MFVYSGNYRIATCGQLTGIKDVAGNTLRTGDIVILWHKDRDSPSLSVVCSSQWVSFTNGTHTEERFYEHYVMGIKSVDLSSSTEWYVKRVKLCSEVLAGEKWESFGFNYSNK